MNRFGVGNSGRRYAGVRKEVYGNSLYFPLNLALNCSKKKNQRGKLGLRWGILLQLP